MNMEGFFLCYGDETPGSVEPTGEHASCFVGGSSECLAQGSPKYLFVQPALRPIKTLLRTSRFGNKKIHTLQSVMHGRSSFTLQRGSTLLALSVQSLSFDDNGITGLFSLSHSEVVFVSFPVKLLAAQSLCFGGSLCHIFTDYSSLQRVFIRSHYNTRFYFVNIFSTRVSRLQNIPAQNNSEIITDGSSPLSETDS